MKYKNFNFLKGKPITIACFCFVLFAPSVAFTQKYSFTNYSIEDGLLQSQVVRILQDKTHHLVIETVLGMNKFDGKTFTTTNIDNELTDSVNGSTIDHSGRVWYSNLKGLYYYYGDKATRFVGNHNDTSIFATALITDNLNNIWGLRNQRLFEITGGRMKYINVSDVGEALTSIALTKHGEILAAVLNKGIFCLKNNRWINIVSPFLPRGTYIRQIINGDRDQDPMYITTGTDIYAITNHGVKKIAINYQKYGVNYIYCITRDNLNGLWIGTNKGAYYLNNDHLKYFDQSNGFTDDHVYDIFKDVDNNIWFSTNGGGIFRFNGDAFLIFDQSQGLSEAILQIGKDNENRILMTDGNKLMAYNGRKIIPVKIPSLDTINNLFHCLYTDREKNTWIVTQKQLFKKTGANFSCFYPRNKNDSKISFNAVLEDRLKTFWAIASDGCYYWDNGFKKISGINFQCTGLIEIGKDSILIAARNGIFLVKNKKLDQSFSTGFLKNSNIMCLRYYNGRLYVGTIDHGLFAWDIHGGPVTKLNEKNGLNSISVYSIGVDKNDVMWMGTGRGIDQFKIKNDGTFQKIMNENISNLFVECNQETLFFNDNQVWIGTTKGVFVFKNELVSKSFAAPYISMQDVQFYNKQPVTYTYENGYKEPENLKLPSGNSHITLSFNGIYLKNPGNVSYSYKLWPLDTRFCPHVNNNVVDYPSLPPGSYVFYVKSYNLAGASSNVASFSFKITPAYYQTVVFKVVLIMLLILSGALAWKYLKVKDEQKRKLIAILRLEEQVKIRKQTAEDFHDDLGNKLTRINVLSDILYKKIDEGLPDQKKLIDQIKENADALFTGSKHILWALDPENDRLSEVLVHIKEFGIDFFLNTPISFTSNLTDDVFKGVTLPMGYGRNITLILKELFNNTLRHSGAKNVNAYAFLNQDNHICITIEDDGKGFDMNTIKSGNGIRNINNRAKKIDGVIETRSSPGKGTTVTLIIRKIPHLY